jgi:hypothetical protein
MDTSNRPCGVAGFQSNGLKIHVWTVRFCPWAPRSTRRSFTRTVASALARGEVTVRQARAAYGVTRSIGGAR